jgi:peptidoglycan/LPS O-acetylase OafA/YrhL
MPEPEPRSSVRIPSLDGIRALSFLVVFLNHAGPAGTLSYSLYLLHSIVLNAVARLLPEWSAYFRAAVAMITCLLVASAIYLSVEKPCGRLRKSLEA